MERVPARACLDRHHPRAGPPELRLIAGCNRLEFLNGVHAGPQIRIVVAVAGDFYAVDDDGIGELALPVHRVVRDVAARSRSHAGDQQQQVLKIAAEQRQFADRFRSDHFPQACGFRLEFASGLIHRNRIRPADGQLDIQTELLVQMKIDPRARIQLEALGPRSDLITAWGEGGEAVLAFFARRGCCFRTRRFVLYRQRSTGNKRPTGVAHIAEHTSAVDLSSYCASEQQQ